MKIIKKLLIFTLIFSTILNSSDYEQPKKNGCWSKAKAVLTLGLMGLANLTAGKQFTPVQLNEDPFSRQQDETCSSSNAEVYKELEQLPIISPTESYDSKLTRIQQEHAFEDLLKSKDLELSDRRSIRGLLKDKSYQMLDDKLENRFSVHQKRYPVLFKTFLESTNEKEMSHLVVKNFINDFYNYYPEYFKSGINIYDIGCGKGEFSASIVDIFSHVLPGGAQNMTFSGIDTQESFVKSTTDLVNQEGVARTAVTVGNFRDEPVGQKFVKSANFVVASHLAYVFHDMDAFIAKVETLLQSNGIAIFIHSANKPIDNIRQNFAKILRNAVTDNTIEKIHTSLAKSGLNYCTFEFSPVVKFPTLNERDWKRLQNLEFAKFNGDYSNFSPRAIRAKNLIEFFLQDPLEAFSNQDRNAILKEFKSMLRAYNNVIPITNSVQVVSARNSNARINNFIGRSIHSEEMICN